MQNYYTDDAGESNGWTRVITHPLTQVVLTGSDSCS
jgi:hypothetical protein